MFGIITGWPSSNVAVDDRRSECVSVFDCTFICGGGGGWVVEQTKSSGKQVKFAKVYYSERECVLLVMWGLWGVKAF